MYNKLREYIDGVFSEAPQTIKTIEVKEEFYLNLCEKYGDLLAEGKNEESAYNIAVASIGDVRELIRELQGLPQQYSEISAANQVNRQRRAVLTSVAIMLYVVCVTPLFIFRGEVGLPLMFGIIAVATGLLVFSGLTKTRGDMAGNTVVEDFREWRGQNNRNRQIYKSISAAVWSLGLAAYFLLSFFTNAWHVTWLIFPLIGALNGIIKAAFDLTR
ncbi:MAG: permease prefix domain 1-containing protein [Oscillospiraceae bacterium]|nr:permease prefix domain 1-containing protein [Oscillospiraceae bacterium]